MYQSKQNLNHSVPISTGVALYSASYESPSSILTCAILYFYQKEAPSDEFLLHVFLLPKEAKQLASFKQAVAGFSAYFF